MPGLSLYSVSVSINLCFNHFRNVHQTIYNKDIESSESSDGR